MGYYGSLSREMPKFAPFSRFLMRRVIIECALSDIAERSVSGIAKRTVDSLDMVESFQVIDFLTISTKEVDVIGRVQFKDPQTRFRDVFDGDAQILDREGEGTYVCFFKGKPRPRFSGITNTFHEGYLYFPTEIRDGRVKLAFLGSAKAVRGFLEAFRRVGLRYRLISLTDARFPPNSPLECLTVKQRRVIVTAFSLGFYDLPRKISSEGLAKKLNIREPTLARHRRKAERRLLAEILRES